MFPRRFAVFFLLLFSGISSAQQDQVVLGKKKSEWLQMFQAAPEAKARRGALVALEVIGPRGGVLDSLIERLSEEPDPETRREIALTLGRMGADAKEAIPTLGETLKKDKSEVVREAAAHALGGKLADFADTQVIILGDALRDPYPGTQIAAALTLKSMGDRARFALPQVTAVVRDGASQRVTRLYAIQILSRLGDEKTSVPLLANILGEPGAPSTIREAALEGLGRLGPAGALREIEGAMEDRDANVRRTAMLTLYKVGDKALNSWPTVKTGMSDLDGGVRYQAIRLAGVLAKNQPEAVATLAQATVSDAVVENRLAAIQELGALGPIATSALPALQGLALNESRRSIREAADEAVKQITMKE